MGLLGRHASFQTMLALQRLERLHTMASAGREGTWDPNAAFPDHSALPTEPQQVQLLPLHWQRLWQAARPAGLSARVILRLTRGSVLPGGCPTRSWKAPAPLLVTHPVSLLSRVGSNWQRCTLHVSSFPEAAEYQL